MLSLPHLVVIFLVALIVLGPEKLPEVARVLGKMMAEFRRVTGDFRSQIEGEVRDLERQARIRETIEYERTLAGAVPQPTESIGDAAPAFEAPAPAAQPAEPLPNEEAAPVETPLPVTAPASAPPEKSPDGESHSG